MARDRGRSDYARRRRRRVVIIVILTLGFAVPGARIAASFPHKAPARAEQVIRREDLR
jgi:hypothetical protein